MDEINKELFAENEKLLKESNKLLKQLRADKEYRDAVKNGKIDALVITDKAELKVYTEETADKIYRVLIENMHEGAVTVNKSGIILYCNSFFSEMVKLPLQKVIGSLLQNFIEGALQEHFKALLNDGWVKAVKEEVLIKCNDGKTLPVLISLNKLELETDAVLSIIFTDLTVLNENKDKLKWRTKQIEQKNSEIESTNKELAIQIDEKDKRTAELNLANIDLKELGLLNTHKESVLATLSHDLRSPLSGIIGTASYLKDNFQKLNPEKVKEFLDHLYQASTDELSMLDYLVEWARIKFASEAFTPIKIKLAEYVNKVFDTFNENARINGLQLKNEIEENIYVFADGKMLLSIIQNIVSNSIKYTPKGGTITTKATKKENKITIEIKDTGIGMSKQIEEKLFTPQMKLLSSEREENKGAGIGLLLVKVFLEKNGGEVWVESEVGKGTTFNFTLPANNS